MTPAGRRKTEADAGTMLHAGGSLTLGGAAVVVLEEPGEIGEGTFMWAEETGRRHTAQSLVSTHYSDTHFAYITSTAE